MMRPRRRAGDMDDLDHAVRRSGHDAHLRRSILLALDHHAPPKPDHRNHCDDNQRDSLHNPISRIGDIFSDVPSKEKRHRVGSR